MRGGAIGVLAGLTAASAALILAAPAPAAPPPVKVSFAKHEAGPYGGEPPFPAHVGEDLKTYWWKVSNRSGHKEHLVLDDRSDGKDAGDYRWKWYDGDENVTDDALGSGYAFTLKPGDARRFHSTVKVVGTPSPFCLFGAFVDDAIPYETYGFVYVNDTGVCG